MIDLPSVGILGHKRIFHPRWKPCPTATTESRVLDLLDEPIGTHSHEVFGAIPVTTLHGSTDTPILLALLEKWNKKHEWYVLVHVAMLSKGCG